MSVWDRQEGEPTKAHAGFRIYRDDGPLRTLDSVGDRMGVSTRSVERWSSRWDWPRRAQAWDDEVHRLEDRKRLDDIKTMYDLHRRVGKVAITKALQALNDLPADRIPAGAAARLLELGTRIERQTFTTTPEDLWGSTEEADVEDAFAKLARELDIA